MNYTVKTPKKMVAHVAKLNRHYITIEMMVLELVTPVDLCHVIDFLSHLLYKHGF
jgi:hypothetical protein